MLRLSGGCALPVKGCHLGSKAELNQGLGWGGEQRGKEARSSDSCLPVSAQVTAGSSCARARMCPVGKPAQNSQEEKVTPVISEKQLDPLAERDGLCSFS